MQNLEQEATEITETRFVRRHANVRCLLRCLCYLLFNCLLFLSPGCTSSNLPSISGIVTLDGQPLKEGTIQFAPTDGKAPSQAAVIQDGKFSTQLHRTNYKVEIHATKLIDTGAKLDEKGPGGGPKAVELLPARYNVQTELTLQVDGPRSDANFELKSK
jgi:hypothetical protein